jgi:hypothetical protein
MKTKSSKDGTNQIALKSQKKRKKEGRITNSICPSPSPQ